MSPVFAKLEQQNFQSFRLKRGGTICINYAEMLWNANGTHRYCMSSWLHFYCKKGIQNGMSQCPWCYPQVWILFNKHNTTANILHTKLLSNTYLTLWIRLWTQCTFSLESCKISTLLKFTSSKIKVAATFIQTETAGILKAFPVQSLKTVVTCLQVEL